MSRIPLSDRNYSSLDALIVHFEQALRTLFIVPETKRINPAALLAETELSVTDRQKSVSLMRVNHSGEIAAQALYQGQALVASSVQLKNKFNQAAVEENDHLHWCYQRIRELDGHPSYLNPFWYIGSLAIGVGIGVLGDGFSLSFLAETECQVIKHLELHLKTLPFDDQKSQAILQQMRFDEQEHASMALEAGAINLPRPLKDLMRGMAKVMTTTAYWV